MTPTLRHRRLRRSRARLLALLGVGCVVLPPWTVYLAVSLPDQYDAQQWKLVWVGYDVALLGCLAAAGWLGLRRRRAAVPVLAVTATLLLCDAWFDVMLDWNGPGWWTSILMAVLVELPLAGFLLVRAGAALTVAKPWREINERDVREVLTHPVRRRILRELSSSGTDTPARLAEALDLPAAAVEEHLRELADNGFVLPVPGAGGPSRWRGLGQDLRLPERDQLDADTLEVFERLWRLRAAEEMALFARVLRRFSYPDAWHRGSRGGLHLTLVELEAFFEDYLELLTRYGQKRSAATPGTRQIAVRFYAFPLWDPADDAGPGPSSSATPPDETVSRLPSRSGPG
jgi:DNA-binding transcriptional ArsR family regulator